ncbi:biotin/lipoate A/B protein ligase [Pyrolobus fumarii 1A]|uniref:Biotin/lipoate A/B protein ligase n=1 Tax=Pyrolobus fumarii (strain DSM 11204 / 1A) TaxID=694429 RepID=G0ED41_PYRF1|nr:biotin/lipoate A/B protein ligase family protein [Pyrolobus fumarii]AEM38600.1 biotin/lipoate A/B protein ligase [Pyrolobus fumarii 1A]
MSRVIRLVVYGAGDACTQMAIDEAMAIYAGFTGEGLARLYWFDPPSVTLGYFQRLEEAVDLEEAKRLGVNVVRRLSGGGSVYHDPKGEVTYSIAVPEEWLRGVDVAESFKLLAGWLVEALERLGFNPTFSGLNDILVNGRKVSGSAQARRYGAVLQHGTVMYDTDLEVLARVLRVPRGKGRDIRVRVTTLSLTAGRKVTRDEVVEALLESAPGYFSRMLHARVEIHDSLPRHVYELTEAVRWRYCSREWLTRR